MKEKEVKAVARDLHEMGIVEYDEGKAEPAERGTSHVLQVAQFIMDNTYTILMWVLVFSIIGGLEFIWHILGAGLP